MSKHRNNCRNTVFVRFRALTLCLDRLRRVTAMFCSNCGSRMQITFKYCPSCGKENKETNNDFSRNRDEVPNAAVSNHSTNNNKNNTETSGNSRATFKAFMTKKNEERTSHFKPAKKQRLLSKQEVTINIGQMEFNEEGLASPLRGKSLPLKIAKDADYKTLLEAALKKRCDYDKTFDSERQYKLVYPDGQSAQTIPGCVQAFTLERYKNGLGKSYGRLSLYLCPFWPLSSKDENIIEDSNFASSESEFDEIGDIESGEIPGSAVTGGPSIGGSLTNSGLDGPAIEIVDTDDENSLQTNLFSEDPFSTTDFL